MHSLRLRLVAAAGAFACTLAAAPRADATVMFFLDTEKLVDRADAVVVARVVSQRVVLEAGEPVTETRVRVTRTLRGKVAGELVVIQPGGELDDVGLRVAGTARFSPAERVVLFLRRVDRRFVPVGMCLGKYGVYRDASGSERVRRDLSGVSFARIDLHGRVRVLPNIRTVGSGDPLLSDLLHEIPASAGDRR